MYWCKLKSTLSTTAALLGGILLLSGLPSCRPDIKQSGTVLKYFDINGYFKADTARLRKSDPAVNKTVTHNGITENKTVHITNWGHELNLFIQSDINRPAWKNSYRVQVIDSLIIYQAKHSELRTTRVVIRKDKDKVKWILIFNHTKNLLYETREKLSYFPDSVYLIEKWQQVRLMGRNNYRIEGTLKSKAR
ncbi:hypothetical protein SNE25_10475 [Mucilaginibacter sabulilitoris]|uniref:Lipoprotein n=1 Tax=Mucilaginibacter sabulilitoris TaxID=1173583 RepID=A0ABZ0TS53_9SPHI|nr:hypothetical protein [Mucilaginibacter sabulilitoris]WPU95942.1 hypothetical protein SNE25_10475 [Mucilaginibacter sabulilitoris]